MRAAADQHTDHHTGTDAPSNSDPGSERISRAGAAAGLGPARTDVRTGADHVNADHVSAAGRERQTITWPYADTE